MGKMARKKFIIGYDGRDWDLLPSRSIEITIRTRTIFFYPFIHSSSISGSLDPTRSRFVMPFERRKAKTVLLSFYAKW